MEKKKYAGADKFIKLPTALMNGREDRPPLNSLEREICAYLMSWTANGRGRYNYESTKEIARRLGSSNKTVLKALHRLNALQLIRWHAFSHGVGVKHLRWFRADGLRRWASRAPIAEPTPEELEKAAELSDPAELIRDVCKKPNSVGFDIWRACCTYCDYEPEEKHAGKAAAEVAAEVVEDAEPFAYAEPEAASDGDALPYASEEFANAWASWIEHRKQSGRPLRGNAERMALQQLASDAESEADALNAIRSAIAGGFVALRPDIARSKSGGATNPPCPVNLWSWMQRQFELRQRQPADLDEAKEWAAEFRQNNPDAPAFVVWNGRRKRWELPGPTTTARDAGVNGKYVELLEGFETIRQVIDGDGALADLDPADPLAVGLRLAAQNPHRF